jgi:hypothetical protein
MPRPIITLTTDFGASDHFVAAMKGVILGIQPEAQIVDVSHDVPPFEVLEGAFLVAEACRWFPKKTVHVVVVDPGVGSARRPILVEAAGQLFVGPDNGVFSIVRARTPRNRVREITNRAAMLHPVSQTFHGRDVFAPVAAKLTRDLTPSRAGKPIADALQLRLAEPAQTNKRTWTGSILHVDRFGNLITNFRREAFEFSRPFELSIGFEKVTALVSSYSSAPAGEPVAIEGSSGYIEICVNQASAARRLGCAAGAPVDLTLY